MKSKKRLFLSAALVTATIGLASCGANNNEASSTIDDITKPTVENKVDNKEASVKPKYVFLFIGDGMSYPQIQSASYYLSANKSGIDNGNKTTGTTLDKVIDLSFMNFPHTGSAKTYDATSFAPDSASTATSLATGKKTWSGSINVSTDFKEKYETITEKVKKDKDYKVGVVTSVNLNHATPAAFYSHQASRNSYYDIALELVNSNFDYFAGGDFLKPNGDGTQTPIYDVAKEAGYKVIKTQAEASKLTANDGKAILIDEHLADSASMAYELDRKDDEWSLANYVSKGIEVLNNDNGFFMMVEGGKVDWACHANDAMSSIKDTIALSNAVDEAVKFYNSHKEETLIIVTGDHETGGLSIGFAGTNYDTYFTHLSNQKISYAKYDSDYVANYKKNGTDFDTVLGDIENLFGLVASKNKDEKANTKLVLTDYEYQELESAYKETMKTQETAKDPQQRYVLYGSYEPLTVTITHILNNKSGISFTSYSHTGLPTAVFALGNGANLFDGYYDNTDIYNKIAKLLEI